MKNQPPEILITPEELEEWVSFEKIPENFGQLTSSDLEKALKQILKAKKLKEKGLSSKEIVAQIKNQSSQDEKKKISKFRQSGHLVDQTLKYTDPKKREPTLFDIISDETKEKIQASKIEMKTEGIRLTPPEDKMMKAISKLLHEKSENTDTQSSHFYSGNEPSQQLIPYGGNGQQAKSAVLRIFPGELYRAYLDKSNYSGVDIKYLQKVLQDIANKKFLIVYDRKRSENGKILTDRIEEFQSLVRVISYIEGLSEDEVKNIDAGNHKVRDKKGELVISLNPIFIDQINTKYIEYPSDINKRTTAAAGGHSSVTDSMIILRDYMLRELSAKRYEVEINEDKLPYVLRLDNYIKDRRKKRIADRITSAIECVKTMGIILSFEKVTGALGQAKYIFTLNKDFN